MSNLKPLTAEERILAQVKSNETKEENKKWATENLRDDYQDLPLWRELSRKYDCRLPHWYIPATETKYVKRTLKKLGLSNDWWLDQTGCINLKEFIEINPRSPAYMMVGLVLEAYDREKDVES